MNQPLLNFFLGGIFFLFSTFLRGQNLDSSIQNYSSAVTKSGTISYSICKNSHGTLFFATTNGILIYDGEVFEIVLMNGKADTRTVVYDSISDKVYAGGDSEFGYLDYDSINSYRYISLSGEIQTQHPFREVWQILPKDSAIYFQTYKGIFRLKSDQIKFIDISDSYIFDVNDQIYITQFEGPLGLLEDDSIIPLYDQRIYNREGLFQIFPFDENNIILASSTYGMFKMDLESRKADPFECQVNTFFKENFFYFAIPLNEHLYAAGTYEGGVVIFNMIDGTILLTLNNQKGLISDTFYDLEIDGSGNLWVAGELGISRIVLKDLLPEFDPGPMEPKTILRSVRINSDSLLNPSIFNSPIFNIGIDRISFEFATPGFEYFKDYQYSFFLEGHDENWSPWSNQNSANFTNLKNGIYTFKAKSLIDDNHESQPVTYYFEIRKPWYNWIVVNLKYLLTGFVISGFLFSLLTFRLRQSQKKLENKVQIRTQELAAQKEELKKANDHLLELNLELDNFVYRSSHDLVAPIKSVKGLVGLLKLAKNDAERGEYIKRMNDRLDKLEKFISEINNYTKNEKKEIENSEFNLYELIENIHKELNYFGNAEKIEFQVNVDKSLKLNSDQERWEMILSNLITNSIKYHNEEEDHPFIKISSYLQNGILEITVEDNGQGIQQEHLDKVFDMFYRANENSEGSGLGLYLVKKTLEKLKGNIRITSEFGVGTQVLLTIPVQ